MITPSTAHAISEAIASDLADVHTAMVCAVQSYNETTQCADLVPQVKRPIEVLATGELTHEELPVLPNVKLCFPRAGDFFLSFPIKKGDFVLVIFNEYSIDQWRSKGRVTPPGDVGHLTMTAGMALPVNIYPEASALAGAHADNMVVGKDGSDAQIHFTPADTVLIGAGADESIVRGDAFKETYDDHVHLTAMGPSGTPQDNATGDPGMPADNLSGVGKVK